MPAPTPGAEYHTFLVEVAPQPPRTTAVLDPGDLMFIQKLESDLGAVVVALSRSSGLVGSGPTLPVVVAWKTLEPSSAHWYRHSRTVGQGLKTIGVAAGVGPLDRGVVVDEAANRHKPSDA